MRCFTERRSSGVAPVDPVASLVRDELVSLVRDEMASLAAGFDPQTRGEEQFLGPDA